MTLRSVPNNIKLLTMAYEHYEKTSDITFSYAFRSMKDWFYMLDAAQQLYDYGYITNVSDSVFETEFDALQLAVNHITFDLTYSGVQYMRTYIEA